MSSLRSKSHRPKSCWVVVAGGVVIGLMIGNPTALSQDRPRILSDRLVAELAEGPGTNSLSVRYRNWELQSLQSLEEALPLADSKSGFTLLSILPERWLDRDFRVTQREIRFQDSERASNYLALEVERNRILWRAEVAELRRNLHLALANLTVWREEERIIREDLAWLGTMIGLKEDRFKIRQPKHNELMALQNNRSLNEALLLNASNRIHLGVFRVIRLLNQESNSITRTVILPRPFGLMEFGTNLVRAAMKGSFEIQLLSNAVDLAALEVPSLGDHTIRMGQALKARVDEAESRLAERLMTLSVEIANTGRLIGVYRDEIQLRGQESVASAMSLWEVNRGSLDEVLRERRKLIADQLELARQTVQQQRLLADLLYLSGSRTLLDLHRSAREIGGQSPSGSKTEIRKLKPVGTGADRRSGGSQSAGVKSSPDSRQQHYAR